MQIIECLWEKLELMRNFVTVLKKKRIGESFKITKQSLKR